MLTLCTMFWIVPLIIPPAFLPTHLPCLCCQSHACFLFPLHMLIRLGRTERGVCTSNWVHRQSASLQPDSTSLQCVVVGLKSGNKNKIHLNIDCKVSDWLWNPKKNCASQEMTLVAWSMKTADVVPSVMAPTWSWWNVLMKEYAVYPELFRTCTLRKLNALQLLGRVLAHYKYANIQVSSFRYPV